MDGLMDSLMDGLLDGLLVDLRTPADERGMGMLAGATEGAVEEGLLAGAAEGAVEEGLLAVVEEDAAGTELPAVADEDDAWWSGLQRYFLRRQLSQAFLTLAWVFTGPAAVVRGSLVGAIVDVGDGRTSVCRGFGTVVVGYIERRKAGWNKMVD